MENNQHYIDFDVFSRALIVSKDVDPTYPLIKKIVKHYKFDPYWFVYCYVGFYSLESAIIICKEMPTPVKWNKTRFYNMRKNGDLKKFGHERRGTSRNIEVQINMFNYIREHLMYMECNENVYKTKTNAELRQYIDTFPNHGKWAAFKLAEIFEKSFDCSNLEINDLGLEGRDPNKNDSPIGGLRWLFGREHTFNKDWFTVWNRFGERLAKGWGVDIGQVETCLCKWHKFVTGKYYIGHDIHEFHDLIPVIGEKTYDKIMSSIFDEKMYKIDGKYVALDKSNNKLYKETGKILNSRYAKEMRKIDIINTIMRI